MSAGLTGAPSTFQKATNKIHKHLLGTGVQVHLDDIIAMAASLELLREVFTLLRNAGLTIKLLKNRFFRRQIKQ